MKHAVLLSSLLLAPTIQAQWQELGSGIANTPRKSFSNSAVYEKIVGAVAYNPSGAAAYDITVTLDGGDTWSAGTIPNMGAYYPAQIHAVDGQTAWALMLNIPQQDRIRIFKTTDGGTNWQDQPGGFNTAGFAFACLHFFDANEGIGFGSPGTDNASVDSLRIYRTMDGGDSWARVPAASLPAPEAGEGQWVYGDNRYESKGDTLWFGTRAGRVFRTTDKGATWEAFNTGLVGGFNYPGLASIAFEDHLRGIATSYAPSQAARTEDGGGTWTPISMPTNPPAGDIEFVPGTTGTYFVNQGHLNASNTSSPYLITHDSGDTWESVTFTPALPVVKFLSPTVGFAGGRITSPTQGGIYAWSGDDVGVDDARDGSARMIAFPNPTSGEVTLELPAQVAPREVVVMDAVGHVLLTQTDLNTYGPLTMDLSDLANGLYVLQVNTDNGMRLTQRIVKE